MPPGAVVVVAAPIGQLSSYFVPICTRQQMRSTDDGSVARISQQHCCNVDSQTSNFLNPSVMLNSRSEERQLQACTCGAVSSFCGVTDTGRAAAGGCEGDRMRLAVRHRPQVPARPPWLRLPLRLQVPPPSSPSPPPLTRGSGFIHAFCAPSIFPNLPFPPPRLATLQPIVQGCASGSTDVGGGEPRSLSCGTAESGASPGAPGEAFLSILYRQLARMCSRCQTAVAAAQGHHGANGAGHAGHAGR